MPASSAASIERAQVKDTSPAWRPEKRIKLHVNCYYNNRINPHEESTRTRVAVGERKTGRAAGLAAPIPPRATTLDADLTSSRSLLITGLGPNSTQLHSINQPPTHPPTDRPTAEYV
eukprot:scaffold5742_cov95-Isochrysis_galbana.AAC.3